MIDKYTSNIDDGNGEMYILDIPYTNEIEVCYEDKSKNKYIRLRYPKEAIINLGESALFCIKNDIRNALKESENK